MLVTKAFANYVKERMNELNLSTHEVAQRATKRGSKLSNGTVWNIANQRTEEVKETTIRALAKGLDVTYETLIGAASANGKREFTHDEVAQLFYEADELSDDDLQEMTVVWNMVRKEIRERKAKGEIPRRKAKGNRLE